MANYRNKFKQQFTKKEKKKVNAQATGNICLRFWFAAARLAEGQFFNDTLTKLKFLTWRDGDRRLTVPKVEGQNSIPWTQG